MSEPEHRTQLGDLIKQMRIAAPRGTVYFGIYKAVARFAIPEGTSYIYGFMNDYGRMFVIAETRYELREAGMSVPRELRYWALTLCTPGIEVAAQVLHESVDNVHTACMLSANAGANVVHETLVTEFPFAQPNRVYRQLPFDELPTLPRNGRFLARVATIKLAGALWGHPDRERLMVTAAHYREALRLWREGAKPLVLLHLYIAVEALTKAVIRYECARRQCTVEALMKAFSVEVTANNAQYRLQNQVAEKLIFNGDKATLKAARDASNGIEHGYGKFQEIWGMPFDVNRQTARYIRTALLSILDLDQEVSAALLGAPYADVSEPQDPPSIQGVFGVRLPTGLEIFPIAEPADWRALDYKPVLEEMIVDSNGASYRFKYRDSVT